MTTQAQLLALGEAHRASAPAINTVMFAISEAQTQARVALGAMGEQARVRREGVDFQGGFSVMLDNTDVVVLASKAAAAMSLMAGHLMTLASLLAQAGVEHSY